MEKRIILDSKTTQPELLFTTEQIISSFNQPPIMASKDYLANAIARDVGFTVVHPDSVKGKMMKNKVPFAHEIIGSSQSRREELKGREVIGDIYITEQEQHPLTVQVGRADILSKMNLFEPQEGETQIKFQKEYRREESPQTEWNNQINNVRGYDFRASNLEFVSQRYNFNPTYFSGGLENTLGNSYRGPVFSRDEMGRMATGYYGGSRRYH